jgi:hypothetical protein
MLLGPAPMMAIRLVNGTPEGWQQLGEGSPWSIELFGTNLRDKQYQLTKSAGNGFGVDTYLLGRPREIGVEVTRRF